MLVRMLRLQGAPPLHAQGLLSDLSRLLFLSQLHPAQIHTETLFIKVYLIFQHRGCQHVWEISSDVSVRCLGSSNEASLAGALRICRAGGKRGGSEPAGLGVDPEPASPEPIRLMNTWTAHLRAALFIGFGETALEPLKQFQVLQRVRQGK